MEKISVGIIGAAGYTGGELIRLLMHHPQVKIKFAFSRSQAGKKLYETHEDLYPLFSHNQESEILGFSDQIEKADVWFLCMGHGESGPFLAEHSPPAGTLVIDLSHDHRDFEVHSDFVYGAPEFHKKAIQKAKKIANPGCFATAINLALAPLAKHQLLDTDVQLHGVTGSTGAGQKLQATTHFTWRQNNTSIYKAFNHQHLAEIRQNMRFLGGNKSLPDFHFIPMRGDFTRGIFISAHLPCSLKEAEVRERYQDFYKDSPFVHCMEEGKNLHLKQVVNTNQALIQVQKFENGRVLISSAIDNLLKGASGQAVQNMNLALGFPEEMGLRLKASVF